MRSVNLEILTNCRTCKSILLRTTLPPRPIFNRPRRSRMSPRRKCRCSTPKISLSCKTSRPKSKCWPNLSNNQKRSNKKFRMKIRVWSTKLNKVAQMMSSRTKDLSTILSGKTRSLTDLRMISFSKPSLRDSRI